MQKIGKVLKIEVCEKSFENKDVRNFLPHREPFLFIDRVERIVPPEGLTEMEVDQPHTARFKQIIGGYVEAKFHVREDLEIFKGHFPGNPIFPGVLQIEMMGQASAFLSLLGESYSLDQIEAKTLLLGVENSKFRKMILPGMDLDIFTTLVRVRGNYMVYDCMVKFEDTVVSTANILASLEIFYKEA